jgi:hypothetical protein
MLGWIATRLPLADPAVATNLLSAVCAALAIGGLGALGWLTCRGLGATRPESAVLGCGAAMLAAVSRPVWSQAVITEVYSLHLALGVALLAVLLGWIQAPGWRWGFAASIGVVALGMSNHHLMLTLVPLPLVLLLVIRPAGWVEELAAVVVASLAILRGWAGLSGDPAVIALFQRLLWIGLAGAVLVLALGRRPRAWLAAWRPPLLLAAGLLPHLYLPLAAAKSPSLCWSCPTTGAGFFHLTNLTSYWGSHTAAVNRVVGRALGASLPEWALGAPEPMGQGSGLLGWLIAEASSWVTLPVACLALVALVAAIREPPEQRRWLATLGLAVLLSGLVLPLATGFDASLDRQRVLRTYLGLPASVLALLGVAGAARLSTAVRRLIGGRSSWVYSAVVAAAVLATALVNEPRCSRRGSDLTEELVHRLLDPLPRGAIVLAISDTTFFAVRAAVEVSSRVATTGLSRPDLVVVTPARLATTTYLEELRRNHRPGSPGGDRSSHASTPAPAPVVLPTPAERDREIARAAADGEAVTPLGIGSRLTRRLVEANIDRRAIVVEMPAPHPWAMDRLSPDGLWLRLEPAPIERLADEVVEADLEGWDGVIDAFEASPRWWGDPDLRLSVADLRLGGVHLYRHRGLCTEAVRAARQAVRAAPESAGANALLVDTLFACGDLDAARRAAAAALARDPRNPVLAGIQRTLSD